jgi:hypothetical protein
VIPIVLLFDGLGTEWMEGTGNFAQGVKKGV